MGTKRSRSSLSSVSLKSVSDDNIKEEEEEDADDEAEKVATPTEDLTTPIAVPSSPVQQENNTSTNPFTHQEDDTIFKGFCKLGPKWDDIAQWSRLPRTSSQIKERFHQLVLERSSASTGGVIVPIPPPVMPPITTGFSMSSTSSAWSLDGFDMPDPSLTTDALVGMFRREIKRLESLLKSETTQRQRLQAQNIQLSNGLSELKQELVNVHQRYEQKITIMEHSYKAQVQRATGFLQSLLVEKSKEEALIVRRRLNEDSLRLASIRFDRHDDREWIQDGFAFTDLYQRQAEIMKEKKIIDHERRELAKKKSSDDQESRMHHEQEEVLKTRQMRLKGEEDECWLLHSRLIKEREKHLSDIRRVRDENLSRFHSNPVLNGRYLALNMVGKGGFSEVFKSFDLERLSYVACKIHQCSSHWSETKKSNYIQHAIREYNIQKNLNHPRIVQLFDVFEIDAQSFCSVLEYCDGQDLEKQLQIRTFTERESRAIILQIVSALVYLNTVHPPIIHYDLKPANILFDHGLVKVADFGLSKVFVHKEGTDGMELISQGTGTYWYLPPECFDTVGTPMISSKVDVWSLGVIHYQLLYGKKPFGENMSQQSVLSEHIILDQARYRDGERIYYRYLDFPAKPTVSDETRAFIKKCLEYDREKRPDVLTLNQHPYLMPHSVGKKKNK